MKMQGRTVLLFFIPSSSSSTSHLQYIPFKPPRSFLCLFSTLSSSDITKNSNSGLLDCLTDTYKFTKTQVLSIFNRYSSVKSPEKPQLVHKYLQELGLSETHIRSVVFSSPQILFYCPNKTLKPKVEFFKQQLRVETSDLGKLFSKCPKLLVHSLNKKLVPSIKILKQIYGYDENNKGFIRVLCKCKWDLVANPQSLLAQSAFLETFGIVGPRLSMILKTYPYIFVMKESKLRDLILRVLDMGFSLDSRMLPHALQTVGGLSNETLEKKLDVLRSFGFSECECLLMFRRSPNIFRVSEGKLQFGIDFFLSTVGFEKSILIKTPSLLMFGMEKRVIPRYKVLQVLKSKRLLKNKQSFYTMLHYNEAKFLEEFVLKFRDDAEELLEAYKGHISDSTYGE
ncbi:Mitochodrial transcription termination factor [Trema orientale]|uniref:Mitochodrial transcription termination factor n=1 Tax=Trema orientale TaxID=63057 RepID=A0A2P5BQ26_TREOI|nr:Mitochodrial transcription termination factor [Trema orientale]